MELLMFYEPVIAMSLTIFLTITMFMALYLTSYLIVYGGITTARKIKARIQDKD